MKKNQLILWILLANSCTVIMAQTAKDDTLTARQIIEKSIAAKGGAEMLRSVSTLYSEIKTEMDGRKVTWIIKEAMPNKGSFEIVYKGRTVYREVFNGREGFEYTEKGRRPSPSDNFKDKLYKRNIFDELDYLDTTLNAIELLGSDIAEDEPVWKLQVTLKNGAVQLLYYSKANYLLLKKERTVLPEKDRGAVTILRNYKLLANRILIPTVFVYEAGTAGEQKMYVTKAYINKEMPVEDFE
jgi:hypothetical protein